MTSQVQRAAGNGGVLQANVAAAFRQVNIATEALEAIAARGRVKRQRIPLAQDDAPDLWWRCTACRHWQAFEGTCGNRDCFAAVAKAALDDMRRAS